MIKNATNTQKRILQKSIRVLLLLVFFLPFIQLGGSLYLSVQFIGFLLLIWLLIYSRKYFLIDAIVLLILMFPSVVQFIASPNASRNILRVFRELLNLLVLLSFISMIRRKSSLYFISPLLLRRLQITVYFIVVALFLFTGAQLVAIQQRYRLWLPLDWYAIRDVTLPTELVVFYGQQTGLRPSAFFTEPSYLGFIILSTLVLVWHLFTDKTRWFLIMALAATALFSKSMLGTTLFFLMLIILYVDEAGLKTSKLKRFQARFLVLFLGFLFFITLTFSGLIPELNRFALFLQSPSLVSSTNYRILTPLRYIGFMLENYALGIPFAELSRLFGINTVNVDNALLGIFLYYGVLSPFLLGYIFFRIKDIKMSIFFIFSTFYNGAIFMYDKVVVLSVVISLYFLIIDRQKTQRG